jgi:hypothetical protein
MAAKVRKIHKTYPKPCCPICGRIYKPGQLHSGEMLCTSCKGTFQAVLFTPPPESIAIRRIEGSATATESAAIVENPDGSPVDVVAEAPCAKHHGNLAEGICDRCGIFICSLCRIELGGKGFCPECLERILQTGSDGFQPERTPYNRGIARICAVTGLLPFFGLFMGPVAVFFILKAIKQWRSGEATVGSLGGLIAILLLGIVDAGYNVAMMLWLGSLMFKKL